MSRTDEIDKIVDEIGDADSLYEYAKPRNVRIKGRNTRPRQNLVRSRAVEDQDKISFALEQLEQLKKLCQEKFNWWENSEWEGDIYDKSDVSNAYFDIEANIDNQINELKGKVE